MSLKRFYDAQEGRDDRPGFFQALKELRQGKKRTHWCWYIFPQHVALGHSDTAKYYGLTYSEAQQYVSTRLLYERLVIIASQMYDLDDVVEALGEVDAMKLRSSMTLFYLASAAPIFKRVLAKHFDGEPCRPTLDAIFRAASE